MKLKNKVKDPTFVTLGKTTNGKIFNKSITSSLTSLPHALITGDNCSGTSDFINSLLIELMKNSSPDELKFIIVDTKMSFSNYKDEPHMLMNPIVYTKEADITFANLIELINERYRKLEKYGVKSSQEFNNIIESGEIADEAKMEYLILVVDDLFDLMIEHKDETENSLMQLAERGDKSGVHMLIATQHSSSDTITESIKNIFSTKIHFPLNTSPEELINLNYKNRQSRKSYSNFYAIINQRKSFKGQASFFNNVETNKKINVSKKRYKQHLKAKKQRGIYARLKNKVENPTHATLGKTIDGETINYPISKFPHALIAGATSSGKSVFLNSILISSMKNAHPDELKLLIIDTYGNDYNNYENLPYMLTNPIIDMDKAKNALEYLTVLMDERFQKFQKYGGKKNLKAFNDAVDSGEITDEEKMPYVVLVIDDLGFLMSNHKDEVESSIKRLGEKAEVTGIHMLIATQFSRREVVTEVIKESLPTKISLMVSTEKESMLILGDTGAEKLKPHGDFYASINNGKWIRGQAEYISDEETCDIFNEIKENYPTPRLINIDDEL